MFLVLHWEVPLLSSWVISESECCTSYGSCLQESKNENKISESVKLKTCFWASTGHMARENDSRLWR